MKKYIAFIIAAFTVLFFVLVYIVASNNKAMLTSADFTETPLIIVDAGHGGMDGGAVGADGSVEKEYNLQIAQKVNSMLSFLGYNTVMTRTGDISLHDSQATTIRQQKVSDIHNRMKVIEQNNNSIFVSIHQNHYSDASQKGMQVFFSKNNPLSKELAQNIQDTVVKEIQPENKRTVKASGTEIYLLYHAKVPAVLVECGFISNYNEAKKLKDNDYQMKLSAGIVSGICNYFSLQKSMK